MSTQLYRYFLPMVTLAPPPGFRLSLSLPLARMRESAIGAVSGIRVTQAIVHEGRALRETTRVLAWTDEASARFEVDPVDGDGWRDGGSVAFIETHIAAEGEGGFSTQVYPSFYGVFAGERRKSFLSDSSLKFADHNVIAQARRFGRWVAAYPLVEVDPARDVEESLVLINAFERPAVVTIEVPALGRQFRERVEPRRGRRVALGERIGPERGRWRGHVFVHGRNRLIVFDAKHSARDPADVTTVEHLDLFRAEDTRMAATQAMRRAVGRALKSLRG